MTGREAALQSLRAVVTRGRFLDDALDETLAKNTDARERGQARDIAYGVCRYWHRLAAIRDRLLQRPLKPKDADVAIVVAIGLYQLEYSRAAPHAAVAETVALCRRLRKQWASGLVNALLRRFQRERVRCLQAIADDPVAHHAHPQWLLEALRAGWPDHWEDIAAANNSRAPMTLRVNERRQSRDEALEMLARGGIGATATGHAPQGITLDLPRDVHTLPGFDDGALSVQDEAAQLAAGLLDAQAGQRFLDACSAPGGKLAHVLELGRGVEATALERDAARAQRTADTLARLGLDARLMTADARDTDAWWDGIPFERILLDVPCSASGVIRRHPDIKLRRTQADVDRLVHTQRELLASLWPLLARGGRVLYATCSVLPEENASLVSHFASSNDDVDVVTPGATWGVATGPGRQILPGDAGMDGFYYALLAKR